VGDTKVNEALRKARKEAGLTTNDAAYKVGVGRSTWERYERGTLTPSLKIAFRCAWLLGYTIEALFGDVADDTKEIFDPDQEWVKRNYT